MSHSHRRTASPSARARTGFFFSAAVFVALAAVGAFLLVHSDSSAATVVLVPTSDRSNDTIGWQRDDSDVDCGSSGTVCSSMIDEDADSPLSNSNERIETESAVPSDDEVTFELTDLPADAELISAVRVRYLAREGNSPSLPDARILVEVVNGASVLGSPSEHDLSIIFQEFSYDVTGLQLTKAEADALYLRITADGGQQVEVSVVNVEVVYSEQPNPSLTRSCGLDIVLVIDHSDSINSSEMTTLKGAMTGFVNAFLPGTPTEIAVVGFDSTAQVLQGFTNNAATANAAINGIPVGGGWTNWDDALFDARNLFPNRTNPDLIIFGSDGNPTARYGHGGNPVAQTNVDTFLTMQAAIPEADAAKAAGVRIITLGIGSQASSTNLAGISSPDAVVVSDFGDLATDLAALADELCGGTITVHKVIDQDGNIATTGDQTDGQSWNFSADASPDSSNPPSGNTDANGQINFDIDLGADDSASVDITETQKAGHAFISASCSDGQSTIGTPGTLEVTNIPLTPTDIVTCTFYNRPAETFDVTKDWQPNNPGGQVNVTLTCLSGTVSPAGAQQITGDNSVQFSVSGFVGDPNCTATESPNPPPGYSSTGTCNAALSTGSCTIINTLNEGDFRVRKDFQPDSGASVSVTVSCSSGTVTTGAQNVTEASPKSWHVTGYTGNPTCTATENPIPAGYTSSGTCSALLSAGECTITNTLNEGDFRVRKDFQPDSGASVSVTVNCSSGTVTTGAQNVTEASPQSWHVTGYTGNPTCTATENPIPPSYTSSGTCSALLSAGECTIVNVLGSANFTVFKDWVPDNAGGQVDVTLSCTNGTVTQPNPKQITGDSSVQFEVTGYTGNPSCTATESPNPPAGYSSTGTCSAPLLGAARIAISVGGQCTIVNTLNEATLTVNKNFVPDSGAGVNVTVDCGGNGTVAPPSATATEAAPAVFTITGFTPPLTCTAVENPVPQGYAASDNCQGLSISVGQQASCTITNTLRSAQVVVQKNFVPDSGASVNISVTCTSGSVANDDTTASEADPANFTVTGFNVGATCTAGEGIPAGYTANQADCVSRGITHGQTTTCTITNTLREGDFRVRKDFSDNNTDAVTVTVTCTGGGTVTTGAQQVTETSPQSWHVEGFDGDPTCTAVENPIPSGYISSGTCSALLSVGECTITNTAPEADFTVLKNFQPDSADSVTVSLSCASGDVSPPSAQASEGVPAAFNVSGHVGDPTCTATESPIPTGYSSTGTCSAALIAVGQCTIVNELNEASLVVQKVFTDDNASEVMVSVTCSSGTVSPAGSQAVSESNPATFVISGFTPPLTCTATENPVPDDYEVDVSDCLNVPVAIGEEEVCTITNALVTPTPSPTPSATPSSTATAPVTATPSPTPTPTGTPTATAPVTASPSPTPTPSPTALPATSVPATPSPSPTALPATSVPATPSPSPTALPVQLPPTGGAGDATSPLLLWLVALGIACLVTGSTFGALALRRR